MTWLAFFLCFFGWFGIASLMAVVREDLALTKEQIGNTIIASVAITVIVRILIGPLCDRLGPRRVYRWLLILGAFPVMGIGLAQSYETWVVERTSGERETGLLAAQTPTSITLRQGPGQEVTIAREDVRSLTALPESAMPGDLDKVVTAEEMADLLAFINRGVM